ncbi:pyruvate:ferredoxin (flavodoxin) oxidoreductase [uncultured Enterococcus sp.]|uniref:pyruvate:ferredoxin (flavodoxin) oxidoreductase n=1 Tax=uncultured Enterococcus sp. TaxID=167972 RepID=UPI0025F103FF|nr:pyruvate:ferredoxin (flavodoxin) oxidoreductase [uncultured Enterococcus sp.]
MREYRVMDGNEAAAYVSYAFTEVAAVYPITPSSPMAELVEQWAAQQKKNMFHEPVTIVDMQSEAGAAGAVHGALKTGALTTTYTASQGLLLMLPNMYKIAGELLPSVIHVASRALTTNALSIFGDHSDVMAVRQSGYAMLASSSVQEAMDLAAIAHLATITSRIPFVHFFDGFRTSHEMQKIEVLPYAQLEKWLDKEQLKAFKAEAMNPNHPTVSGVNQNPDVHFQQREALNQPYQDVIATVKEYFSKLNAFRQTDYDVANYYGDPKATQVIIAMGSITETIRQTVEYLQAKGRKVGVVCIRLYRPFPVTDLLEVVPKTVEKIAVLDRSKEATAPGESLLLDVKSTFYGQENTPIIIGARYGLGAKDTRPEDINALFDELEKEQPQKEVTLGIVDDVTHLSLKVGATLDLTPSTIKQAKFWGFGSDGTVSASKSAIKIIGEQTTQNVQGYFYYDSKKSGGLTISHLRYGNDAIRSEYLITKADYVACHTPAYVHRYSLLEDLKTQGIFVLNTPWTAEQLMRALPTALKRDLARKQIQFYTINAMELAQRYGLGRHINKIMETVFFYLMNPCPFTQAMEAMKAEIKQKYRYKTEQVVENNLAILAEVVNSLKKVAVPKEWATLEVDSHKKTATDDYMENVANPVLEQKGDRLPVSAFSPSTRQTGQMPLGTAAYEKRGIALEVPEWFSERCTMCNECAFVCPHAAIRPFLLDEEEEQAAPEGFITRKFRGKDGLWYRIQVSVEDCTGCGLCVEACPAKGKALAMVPYETKKQEAIHWAFAMTLKQKENPVKVSSVMGSQFEQPLLEFSGACAGCGETPYVKLLTQLFGDRMLVANATGCSSIWGASFPTTPYTTTASGQGPAWSNSLLEDNAEFGYGMHIGITTRRQALARQIHLLAKKARNVFEKETVQLMKEFIDHLAESDGTKQRAAKLRQALYHETAFEVERQAILAQEDLFVKPSQWIIGGDGWAYDIGYGGLDHVIASGADVNLLVLDNEVYSNTGGQVSKATPKHAVAKFVSNGKAQRKKDLGRIAMTYESVYVAQISFAASPIQTIKAIEEAEKFPGPSILIAYTPCIAHGLIGGMRQSLTEAKLAVESGYWPLYRYHPETKRFTLDTKRPKFERLEDFLTLQLRFKQAQKTKTLTPMVNELTEQVTQRFSYYEGLTGKRNREEKSTEVDEATQRRLARRAARKQRE